MSAGLCFSTKKSLLVLRTIKRIRHLQCCRSKKGVFRPAQPHPFISQPWLHTLTGAKAAKLWSAKLPQTLSLVYSKVTQCSTRTCNPDWESWAGVPRLLEDTFTSVQVFCCNTWYLFVFVKQEMLKQILGSHYILSFSTENVFFNCQPLSWAEQTSLGTLSTQHIQTNIWGCLGFAYDLFPQFSSKLL